MPFWLHTTISAENVDPGKDLLEIIRRRRRNDFRETPAFKFSSDVGDTGELSGEGILDENGKFMFTHTPSSDMRTEGDETLVAEISKTPDFSSILQSRGVVIEDSSTDIELDNAIKSIEIYGPEGNIQGVNLVEGEYYRFEVEPGDELHRSANLYWKVLAETTTQATGLASIDDFDPSTTSGMLMFGRYLLDNKTSAELDISNDAVAEGIESASLAFYLDKDYERLVEIKDFTISDAVDETFDFKLNYQLNSSTELGLSQNAVLGDSINEDANYTLEITGESLRMVLGWSRLILLLALTQSYSMIFRLQIYV